MSANRGGPHLDGLGKSARDVFAEVAGYYKYTPTLFEVGVWSQLIDQLGDEPVCRFLFDHMSRSQFMPKFNEAIQALGLASGDDMQAYERVRALVRKHGPYIAPRDVEPELARVIDKMGGWSMVNKEMPDASESAANGAYFKRFQAARKDVQSAVLRDPHLEVPSLIGLAAGQVEVPTFRIQVRP